MTSDKQLDLKAIGSRSAAGGREIKFSEILSCLIEDSPFKGNRKPIWQALNVSSAALSQYVQGQSRPRFETLVDLADFFGVSLDYLVCGRESRRILSDDSKSVARYVDWALADIQSRAGAKSWLMSRIGEHLGALVEEAAERAVSEVAALGGIVTDDDVLLLESFSKETRLLATYLDYDVIGTEGAALGSGRFTQTVATNLRSKPSRAYKFLLPSGDGHSWGEVVSNLRRLLSQEFGVTKTQLGNCQFRIIDQMIMCGSGFYRLDVAGLRKAAPSFFHVLEPYIDDNHWLGYVMHPNTETKGDTLYDAKHLRTASDTWTQLWNDAEQVA